MIMRFAAACLLLPVLLVSHCLDGKLILTPGSYCQAPKTDVPSDFRTVCRTRSKAETDKLTEAYEVLPNNLARLVRESAPVRHQFMQFLDACVKRYHSPQFRGNYRRMHAFRNQVMIAAIEAGRITEAMAQYVVSLSWNDWRSIVDRIYAHPNRHPTHIANLLHFIRMIPDREEQLGFYRHLRTALVTHADHETYLGALFAYGARRVVFAEDGHTLALNQTDEQELWSTMLAASAGYFKRSFLTGENMVDLISFDRDYPEVFTLLFPKIAEVSDGDLLKFNAWKMVMVPCRLHRAQSKLMFFREAILLLQRHFAWQNHNRIHGARMAAAFHICLPRLEKDASNRKLVEDTKAMFSDFEKGQNYETLLKIVQKRINFRNSWDGFG